MTNHLPWFFLVAWCLRGAAALQWEFGTRSSQPMMRLASEYDPTVVPANESAFYIAAIAIGSRRQQWVDVKIDFNSSDLWVIGAGAQCGDVVVDYATTELADNQVAIETATTTTNGDLSYITTTVVSQCTGSSQFNSSKSPSFRWNTTAFNGSGVEPLSLGPKRKVTGRWGLDTVTVNTQSSNITVANMSLAVANFSEFRMGQLGLGLPNLQSTFISADNDNVIDGGYHYDDFLAKLIQQGKMKKRLYSVFRNDIDYESRAILFGAVDTKKFQGNLTTLPMIMTDVTSKYGSPIMQQVLLTGMSVTTLQKKPYTVTTNKYPAVFDSGQRWTTLPKPLHQKLLEVINLQNSNDMTLPCEVDGTIRLQFSFGGGAQFDMPLNDLIRQWNNKCQLAVYYHDEPYIILGDNVLRHGYVVYDQDRYEISMAPIMFTPETNVVEADADSPTPGASMATNYAELGQIYTVSSHSESKPGRSISNLMNGGTRVTSGLMAWIGLIIVMIA